MSKARSRENRGFSLLEVLVATAVLALILVVLMSLLSVAGSSYRQTSGRMDSFKTARVAFDAVIRAVSQAAMLARFGYDDPANPQNYVLKSDLHFICGSQADLGLNAPGTEDSHAVFFQAPLGIVDSPGLQNAGALLNATGFFIAYGEHPLIPDAAGEKVSNPRRFRLFQFFQPRERMTVYDQTIIRIDGIPVSNDSENKTDWFSDDVNNSLYCHPLADNVVALVILPMRDNNASDDYLWDSRNAGRSESHHRLPTALKIAMAVIDEGSAARLGNPETAPNFFRAGLFTQPELFDQDLLRMEEDLKAFSPPLQYWIFTAEIPLNASNFHQ